MDKKRFKVKKIIGEYKETLRNLGIHVERVILYGSYARGTARKDSDIDVVVISKDFKKLNLRERLEILGVAAARIMKPIEARGYTGKEIQDVSRGSFLEEILAGGIVV